MAARHRPWCTIRIPTHITNSITRHSIQIAVRGQFPTVSFLVSTWSSPTMTFLWRELITESRPLKNVARENAIKLEKRKRACITSRRPVNPTVSYVIPHVCRVHKYCFLLRQPKRSAIHRRRIDIISGIISIRLYCLKIGQMKNSLKLSLSLLVN